MEFLIFYILYLNSVGAILAYDALCRNANVRRSASDNSDTEDDIDSAR